MSVKQFVGCLFVGAAASVSSIQIAQAQTAASVVVNDAMQAVQTPSLASAAGISYVQTGANSSKLTVYTEGFLFCGNPVSAGSTTTQLLPAHEDQGFTPAHAWAFPAATDVASVGYAGDVLDVNHNASGAQQTTLTCQSVGSVGDTASGATDGLFTNGWETATATNYGHLVNWVPSAGFDWNTPDWTQVPTNPCISTANQPAEIVEDIACAAVTGVRQNSVTAGTAMRAGTLWTAADATNFTYLFRVDASYGAQTTKAPPALSVPVRASTSSPSDTTGESVLLMDAYDAASLGSTGSYCFLTTLPATLGSTVCSGAKTYTLNGPLSFPFAVYPPPVGNGASSFYVAVVRPLGQSTHANLTTPVVGVSILVDPALVSVGGDKFDGDDVAFGFMPGAAAGFPWMQEP